MTSESKSTGSFPTWDGMRELEARVATLTDDRRILLRDLRKLRAELETERIELGEWKDSCNANGDERDDLAARLERVRELCDSAEHGRRIPTIADFRAALDAPLPEDHPDRIAARQERDQW